MLYKKRNFLFLLLTFAILQLNSQTIFLGHKIVPSPENAPQRDFNESLYRAEVIKKYQELIKNKSELEEFADFQVSVKKFYLNSNTEYESEDSTISYLTKICDKINPYSTPLKIKVVRDAELNACAFEDGTIFINVGLLAKYESEAEIAAVLGHEIGHVIKQHNYKSYDIYKSIYQIKFNSPYQYGGPMFPLLSAKNSFNKLVKQEEESDDTSIELLKKSQYNTKALSTIEEKFIAMENKFKASINYRKHKGLFYFRTHPSTDKRLEKAQKVENNGGKDFLIDSTYFTRLKRWAIDESIYLNFLEQEYNECIELAFNEHLKYPSDPFYLFFITESNRRALAYYDIAELEFISGFYKKEFAPIVNVKDSVVVYSNSQNKKVKRGNLNSVLLKLNSPMLSFQGKDFDHYKTNKLIDQDTIEFLTYADAMTYFKDLNKKNEFYLNNHFFESVCDTTGLTTQEKEFQKLKCDPNILLPSSTNDKKLLFVLFRVDHYINEQNATLFDRSSSFKINHNKREQILEDIKKKDSTSMLSFGEKMNFNDKNKILNYLDLISGLMDNQSEVEMTQAKTMRLLFGANPDIMVTRDSSKINASEVCPELIPLLNKYNYKGVLFSAIEITDQSGKGMYGSSGKMEKWKIKHYFFDLQTKKVRYMLNPNCMRLESNWSKGILTDMPKCFYDTVKDVSK